MSELEQLWKMLEETNAASMKIVLDAKGVPQSRLMLLVDGVEEVQDVLAALRPLEAMWDK